MGRKKPVICLRLADVIGNPRPVWVKERTHECYMGLTMDVSHSCVLQAHLTIQKGSGHTGGKALQALELVMGV